MIGTVLDGRFTILELLSENSTGLLWKARHELLGRTVAIKVFGSNQAVQLDCTERFSSGAKLLCSLDHPSIIKIYDSGKTDAGEPYLVVEYLQGQTLRELAKDSDAANGISAVALFSKVCEALEYAHKHGVLHGALRPDSILVLAGDSLSIKLGDFGIARLLGLDQALSQKNTQTFERFGAVQYLSPEQCKGNHTEVRSDVYSLGCVIYEYMSGQTPFTGDSPVEIATKHISAVPVIPQTVRGGCRDLVPVVMKALSKQPDERFHSMNEFKEAIDSLSPANALGWLDMNPSGPVKVSRDRNSTVVGQLVVLLVLLFVGAGWISSNVDLCRMKLAELRLAFDTALSSDNNRWFESATHLLTQYEKAGRYEDAAALEKRIVPILAERHGADSEEVFQAKMLIGEYLLKGRQVKAAHKWFSDLSSKLAAEVDTAGDLHNNTLWLKLMFRYIEAYDKSSLQPDFDLVTRLSQLGELMTLRQEDDKAISYLERSLQLRKELHGPADALWPRTLHKLAVSYFRKGRDADAFEKFNQSVKVAKTMVAFSEEDLLLSDMADFMRERGDLAQAERFYRQSIAFQDAEKNPSLYARTIAGLAEVYRRENKLSLADENFRNARKIEHDVTGNQPWSAQLHRFLGQQFMDNGDRVKANEELKVALDSALAFNDKYQERMIRALIAENCR